MQKKEIEEEYHLLPQIDAKKKDTREYTWAIKRIYLSYGWNIQFQKRHNNASQCFNYLIRGSLRKLYKYPVKLRKYWETLLYKDLLNNLSCYLPCLCASVSSNISAFGRKYFCLPGRKYFCLSGSKFVRCWRHEHFR